MTEKQTKVPRFDTTLIKGIAVLDALIASPTPLGISVLSTRLSLGKSNVHRMLTTLIDLGFVRQEPDTKRYFPTLLSWELGSLVAERNLMRLSARTIMKELVLTTGESPFLAILRHDEVLYLEKMDGPAGARSGARVGMRVPAIFPASGKLLLADEADSEGAVDRAIGQLEERTVVDRGALLAELAQIRRQGFATSVGGWTRGVNSVAVPIAIENQPAIGAIGLAVRPERWNDQRVSHYVTLLNDGAARILIAMGLTFAN